MTAQNKIHQFYEGDVLQKVWCIFNHFERLMF
jgi:hypothetical protein